MEKRANTRIQMKRSATGRRKPRTKKAREKTIAATRKLAASAPKPFGTDTQRFGSEMAVPQFAPGAPDTHVMDEGPEKATEASVPVKGRDKHKDKNGMDEDEAPPMGTPGVTPEFQPDSLIKFFFMVLFGRRRIGKTVLARWLIYNSHKRFRNVYLYSRTCNLQDQNWNFVPKENRISSFDEASIRAKWEEKTAETLGIIEQRKSSGVDIELPEDLLIFDDIVSDRRFQKSSMLDDLATLGRHMGYSVIVMSQNACRSGSISIQCRGNVDYVFASSMISLEDYFTLAELYFGVEGKRSGVEHIKAITEAEEHTFAAIQLFKQAANFGTCLFKIKGEMPDAYPAFSIGGHAEESTEDPFSSHVNKRPRGAAPLCNVPPWIRDKLCGETPNELPADVGGQVTVNTTTGAGQGDGIPFPTEAIRTTTAREIDFYDSD